MDTLLYAGLVNAVTATLLALGVAIVTRLWRRPALAHALWLLVLLKLLMPPFVSFGIPWPERVAEAAAASPTLIDDQPTPVAPEAVVSAPADVPGMTEEADLLPAASLSCTTWVALAWLTGSGLWLLIAALRIRRFRRLLLHAQEAPFEVQERAQRLAVRLGLTRCPRVWFLPAPVAPLLWALAGSPRMLLPTALWSRLSDEQRDALLVHELAHLRRRDHWVRWLELAVVGLYWWHPLVWWARRELREAEEQCCDAWVVWALPAAAEAYAAALVETLTFLSQPTVALPLGASGVSRVPELKRRLTMIVHQQAPRALTWVGSLAVLAAACVLLPLAPTWAQRPDKPTLVLVENPAIAKSQQVSELLHRFSTLYKEGKYAEAAGVAKKAAEIDPQDSVVAAALELVQLQARTSKPSPQPAVPAPDGRDEEMRDEIELLEVQLEVKRAQLNTARVSLEHAQERVRWTEGMHKKGLLDAVSVAKAKEEIASLEAQILVKQAELREPELRLKQAKRRLDALLKNKPGSPPPLPPLPVAAPPPIPPSPNLPAPVVVPPPARVAPVPKGQPDAGHEGNLKKLEDVEKKLDQVLQDVAWLRLQSLRAGRGDTPPPPFVVNKREFDIPVQIDPARRAEIARLALFLSADQGRTWEKCVMAPPTVRTLSVRVPADGLYYLSIATLDKAGVQTPRDPLEFRPEVVVLVDTVKPEFEWSVGPAGGKELRVEWKIKDADADLTTLVMEYRTAGSEEWQRVKVPTPPEGLTGTLKLAPEKEPVAAVRMRIKDKAGNETVSEVKLTTPPSK